MYVFILSVRSPTNLLVVYRVSWLEQRHATCDGRKNCDSWNMKCNGQLIGFIGRRCNGKERLKDVEDEERPPGLDCYCHKQIGCGVHLQIRPKQNSPLSWGILYSGSIIHKLSQFIICARSISEMHGLMSDKYDGSMVVRLCQLQCS
jgi:hypothetical protein